MVVMSALIGIAPVTAVAQELEDTALANDIREQVKKTVKEAIISAGEDPLPAPPETIPCFEQEWSIDPETGEFLLRCIPLAISS